MQEYLSLGPTEFLRYGEVVSAAFGTDERYYSSRTKILKNRESPLPPKSDLCKQLGSSDRVYPNGILEYPNSE
jgi:hypothetical protein